jgi:phosphohistidine swiveling domain-containing protein
MDKSQVSLLKQQHAKRPTVGRMRRSVDPLQLSEARDQLREQIALSLSMPTGDHESDGPASISLRASSPATILFAARAAAPKPKQALVVPLDSQDPSLWQEVFQNKFVGGKAQHLAEMIAHARLGGEAGALIQVPKAAAVTTFGYDLFMKQLGLVAQLNDLLVNEYADLEQRLVGVRERIVAGKLPVELEHALSDFVAQFPAGSRFAVRSSSTQEDAGGSSFAGQYLTVLNVPAAGVSKALKECYASMWETRLFAYRKNVGFKSAESLAMGVVIQQQIDSHAAGVAFSLNPVTGDSSEVSVEAVWGQGEGLVGGTISPHGWTVVWPLKPVVASRVASEQVKKFACVDNTVKLVDTSEQERAKSPLTDEQAIQVALLALRVSASYGVPYDIEWARFGDAIYLLQARPITSFSCNVPGQWDFAGFDASSVLTLSMSAHAYSSFMSRTLGGKVADADLMRMYFCKAYIASDLWRSFGRELKKVRKGKSPASFVQETAALVQSMCAKGEALKNAPPSDGKEAPHETMRRLLKQQDEFNQTSFVVGETAEFAEKQCTTYVRWLNETHDENLSIASLVDGINYAGEAAYSSDVLVALGKALAADASAAKLIAEGGSLDRLKRQSPALAQLFQRFVERFFFMSNRDEDVSGLRWDDDDSTPWAMLVGQVKSNLHAPPGGSAAELLEAAKHLLDAPARSVVSRETPLYHAGLQEILAAIRKHLPGDDLDAHLRTFTENAHALRALLHEKEAIHVVYCHNNHRLRRAIVRAVKEAKLAGEEYTLRQTLLPTHPVFCLDYSALDSLFLRPRAEQVQILRDAELLNSMYKNLQAPTVVGDGVEAHSTAKAEGGRAVAPLEQTLKGIGCSGGVVTAVACVVKDVSEAAQQMRKGGVLVTSYTDPSWSPLFSLCCAVVLVDGGVLSHAAVVAREMKIPCVVGIKSALSLHGKTITVNGSKGFIEVQQ